MREPERSWDRLEETKSSCSGDEVHLMGSFKKILGFGCLTRGDIEATRGAEHLLGEHGPPGQQLAEEESLQAKERSAEEVMRTGEPAHIP